MSKFNCFLLFLLCCVQAYAYPFYEIKVENPGVEVYDYPDYRANTIKVFKSDTTMIGLYVGRQKYNSNGFLGGLFEPTDNYYAVELSDGRLGYINRMDVNGSSVDDGYEPDPSFMKEKWENISGSHYVKAFPFTPKEDIRATTLSEDTVQFKKDVLYVVAFDRDAYSNLYKGKYVPDLTEVPMKVYTQGDEYICVLIPLDVLLQSSDKSPVFIEEVSGLNMIWSFVKYVEQAKSELLVVGFVLLGLIVLMIMDRFVDSRFVGVLGIVAIAALTFYVIKYFWENPHSMWFVSPSVVGWFVSILCIIPLTLFAFKVVGEFVGSIISVFRNPVNLLGVVFWGAILFLLCRAVWMEVLDVVTVLIWSLTGAGLNSSETGTLVERSTGKAIHGVSFSGNQAFVGGKILRRGVDWALSAQSPQALQSIIS